MTAKCPVAALSNLFKPNKSHSRSKKHNHLFYHFLLDLYTSSLFSSLVLDIPKKLYIMKLRTGIIPEQLWCYQCGFQCWHLMITNSLDQLPLWWNHTRASAVAHLCLAVLLAEAPQVSPSSRLHLQQHWLQECSLDMTSWGNGSHFHTYWYSILLIVQKMCQMHVARHLESAECKRNLDLSEQCLLVPKLIVKLGLLHLQMGNP